MGTTWGGGMGGNVVGVHLLLRLVISAQNTEALKPTLVEHFSRRYDASDGPMA